MFDRPEWIKEKCAEDIYCIKTDSGFMRISSTDGENWYVFAHVLSAGTKSTNVTGELKAAQRKAEIFFMSMRLDLEEDD